MGISCEYAANVVNDEEGIENTYKAVSDVVRMCCKEPIGKRLPKNWKEKIDKDLKRRHKQSKNTDDIDFPAFLIK